VAASLRGFELVGGYPLALVDIPLLYETGHAAEFDKVIATTCSLDVQIARLLQRGLTRAEADQRLAAQWPAEEKARRADYVIDTSGAYEETGVQIDRTLLDLRRIAGDS
jgi:dephospho-CoA kinase